MATPKFVKGLCKGPDDNPIAGVLVTIELSQDCTIPGSTEVLPGKLKTVSAADGTWVLSAYATNDLTPNGTFYRERETAPDGTIRQRTIQVPQGTDGGGHAGTVGDPFQVTLLETNAPTANPTPTHVSTMVVDGALTAGNIRRSSQAVTEAVLVSGVDAALGEQISVTLTANRVVGLPLNPFTGQEIQLLVTQGGAGGFTLTWPAGIKTAWQPVQAVGAISALTLRYYGTNWQQVAGGVATDQNGNALVAGNMAVKGGLTIGSYTSVLGDGVTATPAGVNYAQMYDAGGTIINAKGLGCKGDNSTNDQPLLQTAINALPQLAGRYYGGQIYFPASDPYIIATTSLTPVHNLVLAGPQLGFPIVNSTPKPISRLKGTTAGIAVIDSPGAGGMYGVVLSALTITGEATALGSKGVHALNAQGWTMDQMAFITFGDRAVHIEGGTAGTFTNLWVMNALQLRTGWADYTGAFDLTVNDAILDNITSQNNYSITVPQLGTGFITGIRLGIGTNIMSACIGDINEVGIVVQYNALVGLNHLFGCRAAHNQAGGFVVGATQNDFVACYAFQNGVNGDNTYDGFTVTKGNNNFALCRISGRAADSVQQRYGFTDSSADGASSVNTYSKNRTYAIRGALYNHTGSDGFVTDDDIGTGTIVTTTGNGYDVTTRDQKRRVALAYIAETFPMEAASGGSLLGTGTVQYGLVYLFKGEVITNLYAHTSVAGAGQTNVWMGLYSSALSQVALTGDVKAVFAAAAGVMVCPLTGQYTVPADGAYYIALLGVGGTQPTVLRAADTFATAADPIGAGLRKYASQAGQASLPGTAVLAQTTLQCWFRAA